jgi:hypothetical protein
MPVIVCDALPPCPVAESQVAEVTNEGPIKFAHPKERCSVGASTGARVRLGLDGLAFAEGRFI